MPVTDVTSSLTVVEQMILRIVRMRKWKLIFQYQIHLERSILCLPLTLLVSAIFLDELEKEGQEYLLFWLPGF